MRPVVTVAEMQDIDAAAQDEVGVEVLVERAGAALARSVLARLGGSYGRRVVVVAGRGHNGDDGRVAAGHLRRAGVRAAVVDAARREQPPPSLPPCDLVVDAAYGTGFRGTYRAPEPPPGAGVVAVDIPSGVQGDTGEAAEGAVSAQATVTFAALKPGLLQGAGPERAGEVEVADIGLPVAGARCQLVEDADLATLPARPREAHKWQSALFVVAGSPGMMGSASLCSRAAMRAGAGMVRLGVPGAGPSDLPVGEVVARSLPQVGWAEAVEAELGRCRALALGPGLGTAPETVAAIRRLVARAPVPVLVDADGLTALGTAEELASLTAERAAGGLPPVVATPHAGEFARLAGDRPGPDRLGATRELARRAGAIILLKGSTTCLAAPDGHALLVASGSSRLATAGTGDVLSGVAGAFLAQGLAPLRGAALAAHAHGRAGSLGPARGLVAGDLVETLPAVLARAAGPVDPGGSRVVPASPPGGGGHG